MPSHAPSPDTSVSTLLGTGAGLQPALSEDLVQTVAFALCTQGRRRIDTAGQATARITAERLVDHLEACGYVILRRPPQPDALDLPYTLSASQAQKEARCPDYI